MTSNKSIAIGKYSSKDTDFIDISAIRKIRVYRTSTGSFSSVRIYYKGVGDDSSNSYKGGEGEQLAKEILCEWGLSQNNPI